VLLGILKIFFRAKPVHQDHLIPGNVENILIVRQHNQLGDMLCSVPLFAALRGRFPEAHITLVASPINYEILFSDINPYIDDVITYNKSGLGNIRKFLKKLRSKRYQIGIVPSTVSVSQTSHIINYLSGADVKVGVKSIDGKYNKTEFLLNVKSDFEWDSKKLHQMERNLDIGRQIGCDLKPEDRRIRIALSDDEKSFADEFMRVNFPDKKRPVIALHPGAGKIPNRWSVDNYVQLAMRLFERYHNYTLITSGHIDADVTEELSRKLNELNIDNVILKDTPVRKVGAVIARSEVYITNDTGVMHVAEGVGANIISLFGPTNAYEWAPKGEHNIPIQSRTDNIQDISVDEVFSAAQKLIKEVEA
jgi:heptosyltransferase II